MWGRRWTYRCLATSALLGFAGAYKLNPNSTDSIKSISRSITDDLIDSYYFGHLPGNTPGILPSPYYWWEAGALMGALIDYWYYTGDTKYNDLTSRALLAQVGEFNDYMPKAQVMNEGNDDQGFWGVAVMAAAEYKFPDPPKDKPQWLALAQAVFNTQASRWDTQHCGGGLRWQIFQWNNGYDYKNTISQACFFNIASRLALYTGNNTYAEWADKVWDWTWNVGFIDPEKYWIYDGGHIPQNCTNVVPYVWTYNAGAFMHGVAAMYNYTTGARQEVWRKRLERIVDASKVFFNGTNSDVMSEVACEPVGLCNVDQQSFKAYLARWMAATTKWAPWTENKIMPLLRSSAVAAASICTGGSNGRMCGLKWYEGTNDGLMGLGQQMAVLEVVVALLAGHVGPPVTDKTGGTSAGDPSAGGNDMGFKEPGSVKHELPPLTEGDRAGAYVLTVAVLLGLIIGISFVLLDEADKRSWSERLSDIRSFVTTGKTTSAAASAVGNPGKKSEAGTPSSQPRAEDSRPEGKGGSGGMLSDSDGSISNAGMVNGGGEKRASRITIQEPSTHPAHASPLGRGSGHGRPHGHSPCPPPQAQQRQRNPHLHGHLRSKSMPVLNDPELGIAQGQDRSGWPSAATSPHPAESPATAGLRRSVSQQLDGGPPAPLRKNTLHKKATNSEAGKRPASMLA